MIVAIIGHRKMQNTDKVVNRICEVVTDLIENEGANTFLFGNKGEFDRLCFIVVTQMQKKYSHIKTVYVRAECEEIDKLFEESLLKKYDETYFPEKVHNSHKLCYVVRNGVMIDLCDVLLTYCDSNYQLPQKRTKNAESKPPKSGAQMAVQIAKRRKKRIINLFEE